MGLLKKVEKRRKEEEEIIKGLEIDTKILRRHIGKKIKKQETKLVKKPTAHYKGHKVHTLRPHGTLKKIKDGARKRKKKKIILKRKGKKKPSKEERVSTGIPGLDKVMDGGFRSRTVNLVAGGPGSGKTIFGIQFLVDGIERHDESGVYISFDQTEKELLSDMKVFNWGLRDKIKKKKLVILSYTPEQVENVLKAGGGTVRDIIQSIKAKRVVVDSLTAFTLLHEDALAQRKACLALFRAIKKWGCTALLISEQEEDPEAHSPLVEEFEVDGVLLIYNVRRGKTRQRALEVFKLRGAKHPVKIFPMTIDNKGIRIHSGKSVF